MRINRHTCKSCEAYVDLLGGKGDLMCGECGDVMEFDGFAGCVTGVASTPNRELKDLIEEWRNRAVTNPNEGERSAYDMAADNLERLIEDEEDAHEQ